MENLRDQIDIIDFCKDENLLNLQLLETQEVILRVAYGLHLSKAHKDILKQIIGGGEDLKLYPNLEYKELVLILGGRSGKSTLATAIASYEGCCTNWKQFMRAGELAWIFVFSVRETQAMEIGRNMIFSHIRQSPILRELEIADPADTLTKTFPRTKSGVMVLQSGAAIAALPCSSTVGRGYPIACAIFDEIAYFARESKSRNTDKEIYSSVLPRMIQFKDRYKMIMISTPADKTGILWERFRDRNKNRDLYFCIKAPTWRIRTDLPKRYFQELYRRDPDGFRAEMAAEFVDTLEPLLNERDIRKCMRDNNDPIPPQEDTIYCICIDAAFGERDRFSIAVGHAEEIDDEYQIIIDLAEVITPELDEDIHDAAVRRIVQLYQQYDGFEVIADNYQADAFAKTLEAHDVNVVVEPWTAPSHRSCYGKLRACIKRRVISLPNSDELYHELTCLQVKFLPSGQFTVGHRLGGHDDISDSVARVVEKLYLDTATDVSVEFL